MSSGEDNASNAITNIFPEGLRVLVIDDDPTCLALLEQMLKACGYQVTKCQTATEALSLLREGKDKFDIVVSDVHMPDMDGVRLLEIIGVEMDLPVVMVSQDDSKDVIMRVTVQGACGYLVKPVLLKDVRILWQHVVRKQRNSLKPLLASSSIMNHCERPPNFEGNSIHGDKESCGSSNREKDEEEEVPKSNIVSLKKPRMVWTSELHEQFVMAVNQMGLKNAVPKKILERMNVAGLTRENVASHLQKYRLHLQKKNEKKDLQNVMSTITPMQSQDLEVIQYRLPLHNDAHDAYNAAISNQLQLSTSSISEIEHVSRPNAHVCASNAALVDHHPGSYYNYGMAETMLGAQHESYAIGAQMNISNSLGASEQVQDCSRQMQAMQNFYYNPVTLPSTITDVVNGPMTEMLGLHISSFVQDHDQFDQDDSNSQFDQNDLAYYEHYGGEFEEKFCSKPAY